MAEDNQLENVFGEEFASQVRERTAERRQERNRLTEEQMMQVCSMAINENKFDPDEGDPMFSFVSDNGMTHSILLMQVPDPQGGEVWEHLEEPWEGAARLPLEYLGEWYWCTFPDKQDVAKLNQGDYVIIAGSIEENEGDDGQVYKNVYPVRGCVTLSEAKEMAEKAKETEFSSSEDETEEETAETEEKTEEEDDAESSKPDMFSSDDDDDDDDGSSSSSSGGGGGLSSLIDNGDEDEEEEEAEEDTSVPYDDIAAMVEQISDEQDEDEEPQVYEIEEGSQQHQRLSEIIVENLDGMSEDQLEDVAEVVMDVIEGHQEDEEEEDSKTDMIF